MTEIRERCACGCNMNVRPGELFIDGHLLVDIPPEVFGADRPWYEDHQNLATLLRYLDEEGVDHDAAYVVEKPWKWAAEYYAALRALYCTTEV